VKLGRGVEDLLQGVLGPFRTDQPWRRAQEQDDVIDLPVEEDELLSLLLADLLLLPSGEYRGQDVSQLLGP
jgi:hypothetical protein